MDARLHFFAAKDWFNYHFFRQPGVSNVFPTFLENPSFLLYGKQMSGKRIGGAETARPGKAQSDNTCRRASDHKEWLS
jgi:hypothetical protein